MIRLVEANSVVIARQFNPSVANPLWLVKHGLIREDELGEESAFTNVFAQIVTKEMVMVLTAEQLMFNPLGEPASKQEKAIEKVGKFVELIPHTPYVAVGVNFNYHLVPEKIGIPELTRSLFFVGDSPLHSVFNTPDSRFGGYLSKDVLGCRLKLDVKPAFGQLIDEPQAKHFILMNFNFHADLATENDPVRKIKEVLSKWNEASELSKTIVDAVSAKDKVK